MPLKDVQQSLQLELQEGEQGKTIVVKSVAAGSKAQQVRLPDHQATDHRPIHLSVVYRRFFDTAGCMQNGIAAGQQLLALSQTQSQQFWTLDPNGIEEHKWIRAGSFVWDTLDVSGNEDLELVLSQPAGAKSLLGGAEDHPCTFNSASVMYKQNMPIDDNFSHGIHTCKQPELSVWNTRIVSHIGFALV